MKAIRKPVEVNAWQIPFEADLDRFINDLPKEVKDKINITYYTGNPMLENHVRYIVVSYLDGVFVGKPGDYIVQGNSDDAWVVERETFEDTYEVVGDDPN